jgi:hypothetical protein
MEYIIRKYLYHPNYIARIIVFTGLCKLLIANRIARQEFALSRMLVVLFKSFDVKDSASEDFYMKIHEILSGFLYFYCTFDKSHLKSVLNSILIIITSHFFNFSLINSYDKHTVLNTFVDTRFEFIFQIMKLVSDHSGTNEKLYFKKIILKLVKFAYFAIIFHDSSKLIKQKFVKERNIINNIRSFFIKSRLDQFLITEMDEEVCSKLFPYVYSFKLCDINISDEFTNFLNKLEQENLVYGNIDFKEKIEEMSDILKNKEVKYLKKFEEYYMFLETLKKIKLGIIVESNESMINEEDEIISSVGKLKVDEDEEDAEYEEKEENGNFILI